MNKIKKTVPWTYVINDWNGEEIARALYKKELQKTNQEQLRKGNKLYVKWKG